MKSDSVAIVSGGLDSTTLVYDMIRKGSVPHLLSFNYGQRHKKELTYAAAVAQLLDLRHDIIDLSSITHLISNSALTSPNNVHFTQTGDVAMTPEIEVPEGHYAEDSMKLTVVPNRNMIMLSIAAGVAVNNNYKAVGFGAHSGDHFVYPDCRPNFVYSANATIALGNKGFGSISGRHDLIYAPFLQYTKEEIASLAIGLGVPLHLTWSCYKGGVNHCGRCGTCVERLEAIDGAIRQWELAGYEHEDHTVYDDTEYWKVAIREAASRA